MTLSAAGQTYRQKSLWISPSSFDRELGDKVYSIRHLRRSSDRILPCASTQWPATENEAFACTLFQPNDSTPFPQNLHVLRAFSKKPGLLVVSMTPSIGLHGYRSWQKSLLHTPALPQTTEKRIGQSGCFFSLQAKNYSLNLIKNQKSRKL